jgi:hypothetical protein
MAPEQWRGHAASPASDVYAATCVFFECVTGRPPYASGETTSLRRMHESAPVPAEAVPETLQALVTHGMAKDPARRPPSARDFVTWLEQLATQAYGPDWERRGWLAFGAATAVLAAAFPAAVLGATGSSVLGHGAVSLAGKVSAKGFLGKATGLKLGAGLATAAVAATTVYLVWPTPQHVGGTSSGRLHMYLTRPGTIVSFRDPTAADSPVIDVTLTVTPATVRPGTIARVTQGFVVTTPVPPGKRKTAPTCYDRYQARMTGPIDYEASVGDPDRDGDYRNAFLYPDAAPGLPTTRPVIVPMTTTQEKDDDHYDQTRCVRLEKTTIRTSFTIPRKGVLDPGTYLLSPIGRPRITDIELGPKADRFVNPESAGAQATGALPKITVVS